MLIKQKINTINLHYLIPIKISEYQSRVQDALNVFNDANVEYQGKLQESIQQAQINAQEAQQEANLLLQKENQEYAASLQSFSASVQNYQAEVNKVVTGNQAEISEWQIRSTTDVQKYGADIQNVLNSFNKENVAYQAKVQEATQQAQMNAQRIQQIAQFDKDRTIQQSQTSAQTRQTCRRSCTAMPPRTALVKGRVLAGRTRSRPGCESPACRPT